MFDFLLILRSLIEHLLLDAIGIIRGCIYGDCYSSMPHLFYQALHKLRASCNTQYFCTRMLRIFHFFELEGNEFENIFIFISSIMGYIHQRLQLCLKNKPHLAQLGLSRKYKLIFRIKNWLFFGFEQ